MVFFRVQIDIFEATECSYYEGSRQTLSLKSNFLRRSSTYDEGEVNHLREQIQCMLEVHKCSEHFDRSQM